MSQSIHLFSLTADCGRWSLAAYISPQRLHSEDVLHLPGGGGGFAHFPAPASELVPQSRAQSAPAHDNTFVANFPEVSPAVQAVKAGQGHGHKKSADDIMKMFDKPLGGQPSNGPGGFIPALSSGYNAGGQMGSQYSGMRPPNGFAMQVCSAVVKHGHAGAFSCGCCSIGCISHLSCMEGCRILASQAT